MFFDLWPKRLKFDRSGTTTQSRRGNPPRGKATLRVETLEERATPATVDPTGGGQPFDNRQPFTAVTYAIALEGLTPQIDGDGDPTDHFRSRIQGEVMAFAGSFAPSGYEICAGQLLPIQGHEALWELMGTTFGGDGVTTFGLPDMRGRTPIGIGTGTDLSHVALGQKLGKEFTTLTVDQMPTHAHSLPAGGATQNAGDGKEIDLGAPTLGLNPIVDTFGELRWLATAKVPAGAAVANGRMLNIADPKYHEMYQTIGRTFGGDETTFRLPDLRSRVVLGYGQRDVGEKTGQESIFLDPPVFNVPAHTHVIPNGGGDTNPAGGGQAFDIMQPSIVMAHRITIAGTVPTQNGELPLNAPPLIGSVHIFTLTAVENFEIAGGQPEHRNSFAYGALFDVIGTTYGSPNLNEFYFPDYQERMMVGAGQAPGLSNYILGQHGGGSEKVKLTVDQLPSHTHGLGATLSGNLFRDHDADHIQDAGEQGIAGRTVFLDSNTNGDLDGGELSAVTGAGGGFYFADITPGTYTLRLDGVGFEVGVGADGDGTNLTFISGDETMALGVRTLAVISPLPVDPNVFTPAISDDEVALVQGYYHALLGRDAEPGALEGWIEVMRSQSGEAVIRGIVNSFEFRALQVTAYYQVILGRDGSPDEIDGWVRQMNEGLSSTQVLIAFATSDEFVNRSGTDQGFVEDLYRTLLSREGDAAGVANWTNAVTSKTMTRAEVVAAFLDSQESRDRTLTALYAQILHRAVDPSGQATFTSLAGNNESLSQIIISMLLSEEFVARRTV